MPPSEVPAIKLSAIIPVSRVQDLANMFGWMRTTDLRQVEVIVVLDGLTNADLIDFKENVKKLLIGSLVVLKVIAGNPGQARNVGLKRATSDWLCFWDSDDTPFVDEYLGMSTKAEKENLDLVIGGYTRLDDRTQLSQTHILSEQSKSAIWRAIIDTPGIWRFIFRRSILTDFEFPDLRLGEDQIFLMKLGIESLRVGAYQDAVYVYHFGGPYHLTASTDLGFQLQVCISIMADFFIDKEKRHSSLNRRLFLKVIGFYLKKEGPMKIRFAMQSILKARIIVYVPFDVISLIYNMKIGTK